MHIHKKLFTGACPMIAAGLATIGMTANLSARRTAGTDPAPDIVVTPDAPLAAPKMFELETATIKDIQSAMAEGSLTSVELVNLYLRRIQAYNQSSTISPVQPLNAILFLNPDLLEDAAQADRLRKQGIILGPLHGIPFLVKGSFPIKGMPISGGTTAWRNLITQSEAWSVEKLRQAGGIVMGQANMDTWASSAVSSSSQIAGAVRSPYLQGAYPGGSSGGSGVSSGAYLTHFAFGGETGGSIRNPSDRNALVGYKVSGGSISVNKIIPLVAERDVIGPMVRNAVDSAIVRDIVGKKDPDDAWAPILPILEGDRRKVPETGFVAAVQNATLAGKKIGIIGTYVGQSYPTPVPAGATTAVTQVFTTSQQIKDLVAKAKSDMEAAGATVRYVFLAPKAATTFVLPAGSPTAKLSATPGSTQVSAWANRSVVEYAVNRPDFTYSQNAAAVLAVATPQTNISAAVRGMFYTLDSATGTYSSGNVITFGSPAGVEHYSQKKIQNDNFADWMDEENLDAVVWPMWPDKGRTAGTIIGRDLVNAMYLPGVTVPIGKILDPATTGANALPAGNEPLTMDITGRLFDDAKLLGIAYAYQEATKHRYSPPLAPPISGEVFDYKRQSKKAYSTDSKPPVLTVSATATKADGSITFTGSVADASGVDRLEVSIAGALVPATVNGTTWTAVLPPEAAANVFLSAATSVGIVVLAVDPAGNSSASSATVTLAAL